MIKPRAMRDGEAGRMIMDHAAMLFSWRSEETGEPLELPTLVAFLMQMRGMRRSDIEEIER